MDLRRLRPGEWLAGLGGVVLLVSMFLDWYGIDGYKTRTRVGQGYAGVETVWGKANAWESFSMVDIFLAIAAAVAVAAAVMTAVQRGAAIPTALLSLALLFAAIGAVLLVWRVLDPPGDTTREAGLWVGLGAFAVMLGGILASMRDESFPRAARANVPVETLTPPEGGAA
jgi:hypothetical protein